MRFEYIDTHAGTSEIALYCRISGVSPQGYRKHIQTLNRPYKYAHLLADIRAILEEDEFNVSYGKQRMYEKLQVDYNCPHCYATVTKVMAENRLIHNTNKPKGLTKADKQAQKSDNLLKQDFTSDMP